MTHQAGHQKSAAESNTRQGGSTPPCQVGPTASPTSQCRVKAYALALSGHDADDSTGDRAQRSQLDSQQDDGSWQARSTLRSEHGPTPTGIYWGAIGLLATLPDHDDAETVRLASSLAPSE
ncbi:MAG: hypothetical protein GY719_11200 [bacterium]|nr:hypothetical protein [bacterium]